MMAVGFAGLGFVSYRARRAKGGHGGLTRAAARSPRATAADLV
jgi:hypothetical protein